MDLRETLEELGYQSYHSNVLIYLVSSDKFATAKEISINADVPLSRIYSILIELEKQGLVRSIPGKKTTYTVVEKKRFLQQVGKQK
jgi:sugar-specific transcriptional regulator TrmB